MTILRDAGYALEAVGQYVRYRLGPPKAVTRLRLAAEPSAAEALSGADRRMARRVDRGLALLGVRCLGRAVVVAQMLRRRGLDARIVLAVSEDDPKKAHAEAAVGAWQLREMPLRYRDLL